MTVVEERVGSLATKLEACIAVVSIVTTAQYRLRKEMGVSDYIAQPGGTKK